jgi:SAM-dependent methyltransferase
MTATPETGYTPAYTLDNQWRAARERLELLERCFDPLTERHLDDRGVDAGWHCLEVGAGGGSVVRMLCERVGPEGRVLAVDLEPRLLDGLSAPNLEVRRLDVVTEALPEAAFDLIHTRAVLLHIPQRDEVLASLLRALRPGGLLLLEELDLSPALNTEDGFYRRAIETAYRPLFAAGLDPVWAGTLPAILDSAGLVDTGSTRDLMTFTGGSTMAEFFRVTWLQFLESLPYSDADRQVIEAARTEFARPCGPFDAWALVAAWGRRP